MPTPIKGIQIELASVAIAHQLNNDDRGAAAIMNAVELIDELGAALKYAHGIIRRNGLSCNKSVAKALAKLEKLS